MEAYRTAILRLFSEAIARDAAVDSEIDGDFFQTLVNRQCRHTPVAEATALHRQFLQFLELLRPAGSLVGKHGVPAEASFTDHMMRLVVGLKRGSATSAKTAAARPPLPPPLWDCSVPFTALDAAAARTRMLSRLTTSADKCTQAAGLYLFDWVVVPLSSVLLVDVIYKLPVQVSQRYLDRVRPRFVEYLSSTFPEVMTCIRILEISGNYNMFFLRRGAARPILNYLSLWDAEN